MNLEDKHYTFFHFTIFSYEYLKKNPIQKSYHKGPFAACYKVQMDYLRK